MPLTALFSVMCRLWWQLVMLPGIQNVTEPPWALLFSHGSIPKGRECAVREVLCLLLGPKPKWARGGEPLCREAEPFYHFQDPVHPFLLLINGSWQPTAASGGQSQQGTHWGSKSCQGSFILTQYFSEKRLVFKQTNTMPLSLFIFISYWRERKQWIELFTHTRGIVQFS